MIYNNDYFVSEVPAFVTTHRILIVRLPCKKVYPIGPVYLMGLLRRAAPQMGQKLLDLALLRSNQRIAALQKTIQEYQPAVIAFSWRDIQVFSPHDADPAMRDAFVFFHETSPLRWISAAFKGLGHILTYHSGIDENLKLIRKAAGFSPDSIIAVGGPSIRIFGERFRAKLPPQVRLFPETNLEGFFRLLELPMPKDPIEPDLDLESLETSFPEWTSYRGEVVGVQTKQGCPHVCLYCLYGFLEGKEVRRRDPDKVIKEINAYHQRWRVEKFWFADAQLLSGPRDHEHLSKILKGMHDGRSDIRWSGYLRINDLDRDMANLMVRTGLYDLEVSLNSGSQTVLDQLRMGFSTEEVIKGCELLKTAEYSGRILINLSLNAPGESKETLRETIGVLHRIRRIFGEERVFPVIFFLGIQPNTGLEQRALEDGLIHAGYDPLSPYPWDLRKLIYNPPPLGKLIGRCCAQAFRKGEGNPGDRVLECLEEELNRV
jgi:hypothetical protein